MTVREMASRLGLTVITGDEPLLSQKVTGAYACDLLSHAMAKVEQGDAWMTVHTNLNVIAVASLKEAACVIIPESIAIEPQTVERAIQKEIVLLSSQMSAARLAFEIISEIGSGC